MLTHVDHIRSYSVLDSSFCSPGSGEIVIVEISLLHITVLLQRCADHPHTHAALSCGKHPAAFAEELQLELLYDCRASIKFRQKGFCHFIYVAWREIVHVVTLQV